MKYKDSENVVMIIPVVPTFFEVFEKLNMTVFTYLMYEIDFNGRLIKRDRYTNKCRIIVTI